MDAHAPGKVTEKDMIARLSTRHANSECGVGKGFLNNTDEFNDILGHRSFWRASRKILQIVKPLSKPNTRKLQGFIKILLWISEIIL